MFYMYCVISDPVRLRIRGKIFESESKQNNMDTPPVLRIRIRRIRTFLQDPDPVPDPAGEIQ